MAYNGICHLYRKMLLSPTLFMRVSCYTMSHNGDQKSTLEFGPGKWSAIEKTGDWGMTVAICGVSNFLWTENELVRVPNNENMGTIKDGIKDVGYSHQGLFWALFCSNEQVCQNFQINLDSRS